MSDDQNTSLGEFEGYDVRETAIELPNASGGLNEAMKTEPRLLGFGESGFLVLEWEVVKIRHQPTKAGSADLTRVHVLRAGTATFIDDTVVKDAVDCQREANDRRKDLERGQGRLPTDTELHAEHDLGQHSTGLVEGCPDCDEERDEEDGEREDES